MKKIIGIVLIGTVILSSSVFAIDGRSDGETKSNTSAGGSPYVPIPVGMAINEKGLPGNSHSCPKGCRRNRRVNDCRCAQGVNRIMNIPGTSPVGGILPAAQDVSDLCGTPPVKSKEDVYVRKIKTKGGLKSDFSIGEPGVQVEMIPSDSGQNIGAKDRNPNSVKCACGTDVRGKDEAACGRICDFLKNNTNKSVCSAELNHEVKSPRDAASGLATGKRSSTASGDESNGEQTIVSPRDPASGLPTGKRIYKPSSMGEGDVSGSGSLELDYTGPCRPPYLCLDISLERKGWDGTIKGITETSALSSPRDPASGLATGKRTVEDSTGSNTTAIDRDSASGLPTGKRMHKPITIRISTDDQDCDGSDDDCDAKIIIEADTDGDGEREPLGLNGLPPMQPTLLKEKPKTGTGSTGEGKKEYVGHVSLMK